MSLVDVPPAPENVSDAVPEGTVAGLLLLAPLLLPVPVGIAATGDGARDVDQVFYNEGETVEGARPRGRDPHPRSGNEGAEVGDGHRKALTIVSVGAVQPTMPPWARIIARVAALNWGK